MPKKKLSFDIASMVALATLPTQRVWVHSGSVVSRQTTS
jgi:hypothetical protein